MSKTLIYGVIVILALSLLGNFYYFFDLFSHFYLQI